MPILTVFDKDKTYSVAFEGTPTVQQVLEQNNIAMAHPCGGKGICGKCKIEISGQISELDEKEKSAGFRMSCRTKLFGDANVSILRNDNLVAETSIQKIKKNTQNKYKIGAAVDIGTTTVVLSIYDLQNGNCIASKTALNPQSTTAADVIGRIEAAINGQLENLQNAIISCIKKLAESTGFFDLIDKWVITGNTTMLYLLTGKNPKSLAKSPFIADYLFDEETTFLEKPLYIPKCIHAFVGADITCAILNSKMCNSQETSLLCDIGTNGELALWKNGKLYTTSTAAGPAFEGAGISCGCQSVPGAIEKVEIDSTSKNILIKTIDNKTPIGICGSGIIDTVACLLNLCSIDETGAMEDEKFELEKNIFILQQDVRSIQLAKAAISAGIKTLLEATNTSEDEIKTLFIAGGFGSHLNIESAVRIGLIQKELQSKIKVIGNAALKGAACFLTDSNLQTQINQIINNAENINLGGMPEFNNNYIEMMIFPE